MGNNLVPLWEYTSKFYVLLTQCQKKKIDRVSNIIAKPIHLLTTGQTGTLSLAGTFLEYKTWCILGECLDKFSSLGALGEMFWPIHRFPFRDLKGGYSDGAWPSIYALKLGLRLYNNSFLTYSSMHSLYSSKYALKMWHVRVVCKW